MITRYKTSRQKVKSRIKHSVRGSTARPRLSVFRSNRHIYAQLIDDEKGATICAASDKELSAADLKGLTKSQIAEKVGQLMANKARKLKADRVVFDRGGYRFHGRVKALAEGARAGGLQF